MYVYIYMYVSWDTTVITQKDYNFCKEMELVVKTSTFASQYITNHILYTAKKALESFILRGSWGPFQNVYIDLDTQWYQGIPTQKSAVVVQRGLGSFQMTCTCIYIYIHMYMYIARIFCCFFEAIEGRYIFSKELVENNFLIFWFLQVLWFSIKDS